jgi:5,10-methylenetetrahydromethanopterin reductase
MNLGLCFDGMRPMAEMVDLARAAEAAGIRSMWMAEHMGYREAVGTCMAVLTATERLAAVPVAISPYSRHALIHAMAGATLAEAAPGRVKWCLGMGNPMALSEMGIEPRRPVAAHREYVSALRAFWNGDVLHRAGEAVTLRGARMNFHVAVPIPILIAAMGPKMLELSGEIADGVVFSAGLSHAFMKHSLEAVAAGARKAGRAMDRQEIVGFVITAASRDRAEAMEAARAILAYLFRSKLIAENVRYTGTRIDLDALADAASRRDWDAAKRHVTDEVIHAYAVAGTVEECRRRLRDYLDVGLTTPVLLVVGEDQNRRLALEIARAL